MSIWTKRLQDHCKLTTSLPPWRRRQHLAPKLLFTLQRPKRPEQFQESLQPFGDLNKAHTHSLRKNSDRRLECCGSGKVRPVKVCLHTQFWDNAHTGLPSERSLEGETLAQPDYITDPTRHKVD